MPSDSVSEVTPVHEGDVLDGKYRVERVLGVGGMGVVVAATHAHLNQRVAIEFLLPAALANPQLVERFAREARAAAQIQSEHVARVIDVGVLPSGSPYMVMEYLEGADLADTLLKGGPLPVPSAIGYVLQACEAIAEAHALGIVHRDLKPANLFLARRTGRDPVVKVLDFGISKTREAGSGGLTRTAAVMGSPYYMAPEQMMSSKDVDARCDIWALGVVLYELLTGAPPFVADSMAEIVFAVTQRDAPPLSDKRADIPHGLAEVVARCLARDPTHRYANVAKLAGALAPYGPPRSDVSVERIARVLATSLPPAASSPVAPAPMRQTASTWASSHALLRGPGVSRRVAVVAVVAGCVAIAGGAAAWSARAVRSVPAAMSDPAAAAPPAMLHAAPTETVLTPLPSRDDADASSARVALPAAGLASTPPMAASPVAPSPLGAATSTARPASVQASRLRPAASAAAASATSSPPAPPAPPSRGLNMGMKE